MLHDRELLLHAYALPRCVYDEIKVAHVRLRPLAHAAFHGHVNVLPAKRRLELTLERRNKIASAGAEARSSVV